MSDDNLLAVERGCRRPIQLVAERERFADAMTEGRIVWTSQKPIGRQTIGR